MPRPVLQLRFRDTSEKSAWSAHAVRRGTSLSALVRRLMEADIRIAEFEESGQTAKVRERVKMREAIRPGFGVNDLSGYRPDPK
jgi:hypothetical protein